MDDDALRGLADWNLGWADLRPLEGEISELWVKLRTLRVQVAEKRAQLFASCPLELTELEVRFWSKVDIVDDDDSCWPWKGTRRPVKGQEYGLFRLENDRHSEKKNGTIGAHRMAFVLANGGDLPDHARHTCDNPPCCRPKHLLDGSHADNMRDRKERGRYGGWTRKEQRGEANDSAVLTDAIVLEARRRYRDGEPQPVIADALGVDRAALGYAIRGATWQHLDEVEAPVPGRRKGSRLTDQDIRSIRRRAADGEPMKDIATELGMSYHNILAIVRRRSWKHVD